MKLRPPFSLLRYNALANACWGALYALTPACYPTRLRQTGVGAAWIVNAFAASCAPLVGGALVRGARSSEALLLASAALIVVAGACSCALPRGAGGADEADKRGGDASDYLLEAEPQGAPARA